MLGRDDGPTGFQAWTDEPTRGADDIAMHGYDDRVTDRRPRTAVPLRSIVVIGLAVLAVGCGPASRGSGQPVTSLGPSTAPASAHLTAVPGGVATPVVGASIGPPTTTTTEFGKIFDALPASFPKLPDQEPADTIAGPTSGSFVANTTVAAAAAAIRAGLTAQGWTVDVGSPLEDGSVVLEAAGPTSGCKTEVRFTPLSGTVIMSVLYGASCPFG